MNSACEWVPAASRITALTTAIEQQAEVEDRLPLAGQLDRAARQDLLELAEGDLRAPERDRADDRAEQLGDLDPQRDSCRPKPCRYSTHAISATAPPPTPLKSATICGIAVIFTFSAAGIPIAVPITTPSRISQTVPEPDELARDAAASRSTAIAMPAAAILLPRTAVRGPVSPVMP